MMNKNTLQYLMFFCTLFACEKPLILNYKNIEIKQSIIGTFQQNKEIKIYISKSKRIDDNTPVEFISNAKVQLFEDDVFVENLSFVLENANTNLGYYISTIKTKVNKKYKIISSVEGLPTAEAEEILMTKPNIISNQLLQYPDSLNIYKKGVIDFTIEDSASTKDYYVINVFEFVKSFYIDTLGDTIFSNNYYQSSFTINEYPRRSTQSKLYIKDDIFNGIQKDFRIEFQGFVLSNPYIIEQKVYFEIAKIGVGYYNYFLSDQENKSGVSNNNKEPNSLISNIKNGYGHFSSYNLRTFVYSIQ
jgi:hypothetical protein